ncbi:hypothetical protein [Roseibium alexandrii]|uniref:hypothetical protein n=1 Tax=Roseibium alexandrii TaxID=388408 RepID=UPI0037529D6D
MKIAGLDIATNTGWCIAEGQSFETGLFRNKSKSEAERNYNFRRWLWGFLKIKEIEFVAIEERIKGEMTKTEVDRFGRKSKKSISNDSAKATAAYLNGCAQEVCFSLSIPFVLVPVQTWRAAFNGGQKPAPGEDQKDVTRRICEMMKIDVKSKDAADAAGIAFWAQIHTKTERLQGAAGPLFEGEAA